MNEKVYAVIQRWAGDLDGVFTLPNLSVALGDRSEAALYKRLNALVDAGMLFKVKRGIYATPEAISNRIEPAKGILCATPEKAFFNPFLRRLTPGAQHQGA